MSLSRLGRTLERLIERNRRFLIGEDDPNDERLRGELAEGLTLAPLSTASGRRRGALERVEGAMMGHALRVEFDALATRVLFDESRRATGVEYRKGRALYRACSEPASEPGALRRVLARREVILAAGAFNTPQLLMLSGVGPPDELARHGIEALVPLDGVGRNLQDRCEIGVIHKTRQPWECLRDVAFSAGDPIHKEWERGRGMYQSNGAAVAFSLRSKTARAKGSAPDLFVMALVTRFFGYFTGYSDIIRKSRGDLTFAVLKAHTNNRGGRVRLTSPDPRDPPAIDFCGFEEGTDKSGEDLDAVVDGVERVRSMAARIPESLAPEDTPGADVRDRELLRDFIRRHAWGHHASCTCPIGPAETGGVLGSDFRVHGTTGLRVVDASVFPRIPGFFIVCAIYMVAEKAADIILDATSARPSSPLRQQAGRRAARRQARRLYGTQD